MTSDARLHHVLFPERF